MKVEITVRIEMTDKEHEILKNNNIYPLIRNNLELPTINPNLNKNSHISWDKYNASYVLIASNENELKLKENITYDIKND